MIFRYHINHKSEARSNIHSVRIVLMLRWGYWMCWCCISEVDGYWLDHCCQSELCPVTCERCDGKPDCYDLSDGVMVNRTATISQTNLDAVRTC